MPAENKITKRRGPDSRFVWRIVAIIVLCGIVQVGCVHKKDPQPQAQPEETANAAHEQEVATLERQVATLKRAIADHEQAAAAHEQEVATLEQAVADHEQEVASLKEEIAKLEEFKHYPGARMVKVVDDIEFAFRWCPAGEFAMGAQDKEKDSEWHRREWNPETQKMEKDMNKPTIQATSEELHPDEDEKVAAGFWILETEVTVGMFRAFVNKTGYQARDENKPAKGYTGDPGPHNGWPSDGKYSWETPGFYFFQHDKLKNSSYEISVDQPVTTISYKDAEEFCKWLSEETGLNVDLPTEVQWEYACRAGTSTVYSFGDAVVDNSNVNCNAKESFNANAPEGSRYEYIPNENFFLKQPLPVRHYKPNNWGIYDMHGNVREWCKDWITKGGGWQDIAWGCRSAWHWKMDPETRIDYQGFRIIISEN